MLCHKKITVRYWRIRLKSSLIPCYAAQDTKSAITTESTDVVAGVTQEDDGHDDTEVIEGVQGGNALLALQEGEEEEMQQQQQQQQQQPVVDADDRPLVAGMHVAPKKKKLRAMNAALALLAKDKEKDKKEKKKDRGEKSNNLLVAANVVQKCGIARGAPLVFAAPEHIDVYPRSERMCDAANARAKMQAWSSDMAFSALTLVYHREPIVPPLHLNDSLQFEARFDSGNLKRVDRVGKSNTYNLVLRADLGTKGHTQWFYFRVRNMRAGVPYTFKIINFYKKCSLWSQGLQPLLYSTTAAASNGGWRRCGGDVVYYKNGIRRRNSRRSFYTLSFTTTFQNANDQVRTACCSRGL